MSSWEPDDVLLGHFVPCGSLPIDPGPLLVCIKFRANELEQGFGMDMFKNGSRILKPFSGNNTSNC